MARVKLRINFDLPPFLVELTPHSLKVLRHAYKMTQAELAESSGVGEGYIKNFEAGSRTSVSVRTARKLGKPLNVVFFMR